MTREEVADLAKKMLAEAEAIDNALKCHDAMVVNLPLTDPGRSAQSFGGDWGAEKAWHHLFALHSAADAAKQEKPGSYAELTHQIRQITRLVGALLPSRGGSNI